MSEKTQVISKLSGAVTSTSKSTGKTCEHEFARHVGVQVFNKKGMAWVQLSLVVGGEDLPEMWICVHCGEEGYEVPA